MNLRDKLIYQALLTLNLLVVSQANPKLSAQAHINCDLDYNKTQLAPPGINVLAHARPEDRRPWDPYTKEEI